MATYSELKRFVGRLFRCRDLVTDTDDDIIVTFPSRNSSVEDESISFTISNTELKGLYDKVTSSSSDTLELFTGQSYETAIDLDYPLMHREDYPVVSEDTSNGIRYTFGFPSIEYCIFLFLKIVDRQSGQRPLLPMKLRRPIDYFRRYDSEEQLSFYSLLPKLVGELSLKIETNNVTRINVFRNYKTSFVFQFMYRSGLPLVEFTDIDDMFHLNRAVREQVDFTQLDTPPLREYTSDVVDYYKLALASTDPYIKYISFYHIMEYFYDEVFKKKMITDLRDRITHPDFVYKDDEKIYEIALFVKNRMRMDDKSGLGDERESLKYVLSEYVPIEVLKTRISAIDANAVQYYQTSKVAFCNAPTIPWTDTQGVYTQLAKRIYFTRNSLVHSKSGKNQDRYKPYSDEIQLQKEIPLVKAIAELIIINSSTIM